MKGGREDQNDLGNSCEIHRLLLHYVCQDGAVVGWVRKVLHMYILKKFPCNSIVPNPGDYCLEMSKGKFV